MDQKSEFIEIHVQEKLLMKRIFLNKLNGGQKLEVFQTRSFTLLALAKLIVTGTERYSLHIIRYKHLCVKKECLVSCYTG